MSRIDKAWRLVQNQRVEVVGDDNIFTIFSVTSDSNNKKVYAVTYNKDMGIWLCNCPDYAYRSAQLVMDDDGEHIGSFICGHIIGSIMELARIKGEGQQTFGE